MNQTCLENIKKIDTPLQKDRHSVKPGITGLAQTQGRLDLSLQERLYWDLEYVNSYNLFLDLKIIFQTIMSVI